MARKSFFCIDAHTTGNPVRVISGGGPLLDGNSMSERRQHFLREFDWIRRSLMFEPRGHDMMSGSILYSPTDPNNDIGILFIETSGCLPMCGHGTIGTVTVMIEEGLVTPKIPGKLRLEVPAGLVLATYEQVGKKVKNVTLTNIASYLEVEELSVNVTGLGNITLDIAYGGNFYAIIDPQQNFPGLQAFTAEQILTMSREVRQKVNAIYQPIHPENPTIRGCTHVQWTGTPLAQTSHGRNAVFYGDKAIDRSPCGTGTSARMAQRYFKGQQKLNEAFIHESIIGSTFTGKLIEEVTVGTKKAVIPTISGWAMVTGYNHIIVDDDDPYVHGFQVI